MTDKSMTNKLYVVYLKGIREDVYKIDVESVEGILITEEPIPRAFYDELASHIQQFAKNGFNEWVDVAEEVERWLRIKGIKLMNYSTKTAINLARMVNGDW